MRRFTMLLIPLCIVAATGCQTTREWTDWKDISAEQSLVSIVWPPETKPVDINRRARSEKYIYDEQEHWSWGSGAAWVHKLPGNRYSKIRIHDAGSLEKYALSGWKHLKGIGLRLDEGDVQMGANKVGKYFYAVSDRNTAGQVCFVYFQALPLNTVGSYRDVPGASGGSMTAFDCRSARRITVAEMKAQMVLFVENIRMR